jgi:NAD(P)-dependent dehydrogenase (short-subunit alcohol dehydrogenase family)
MIPPIEQVTKDGYDLQFGTNVVGHFYLTKLLLPILLSTAKGSPDRHVRILTVSSVAHLFSSGVNYNTFKDGPARKAMNTAGLYKQSKFVGINTLSQLDSTYSHPFPGKRCSCNGARKALWGSGNRFNFIGPW